MFRIRFSPNQACWLVELSSCYGLIWTPIKKQTFGKLEEAESYVTSIGLDKAYPRSPVAGPDFVNGSGANFGQVPPKAVPLPNNSRYGYVVPQTQQVV